MANSAELDHAIEHIARINHLDIKCHGVLPNFHSAISEWNGLPEKRKVYIVTCPICKRWLREIDSFNALALFASGNTPWQREQRAQRQRVAR